MRQQVRKRHPIAGLVVLGVGLAVSSTVPASSQTVSPPGQDGRPQYGQSVPFTPPTLLGVPTINGSFVVGQTLLATANASGDPQPTLAFQWQRCDRQGFGCQDLEGATGSSYTLADADAGDTLRVQATASNGHPPDSTDRSAPTDIVQEAGGDTVPSFEVWGTDVPTAVVETSSAKSPGPPRLTPFPVVRLRGHLVSAGADVTLFTVAGAANTQIEVVCTGRGCPRRRLSLIARTRTTRIRAFERLLPVGVRLSVRVSRSGFIGKYTSFVIRRGVAPSRRDMCLSTGLAPKPMNCG